MQHWSIDGEDIVGKSDVPLGVSTYLLSDQHFTDFRSVPSLRPAVRRHLTFLAHLWRSVDISRKHSPW